MKRKTDQRIVIVADLFCGAGGSSTGARKAIEEIGCRMDLVAINHWALAVETHQRNHPDARHLVEDVSLVDPETIVPEGRLDLLMASPECKYYSRARGGKPIHDQGRMNPWAVHNWLTKLDVRSVLIENVPEFVEWGRLDENGRPDKGRKGEYFQAWFLTFLSLGYQAEWRMLNAADYGDATTRTRFFLQARNDGLPIQWPEPTHARGDTGMFPGRLPWRGAREIINWENLGRSLIDDPKYIKKPLSIKTRQRIARGLQRFGGPLAPLYIRLLDLEEPNTETVPGEDGQTPLQGRSTGDPPSGYQAQTEPAVHGQLTQPAAQECCSFVLNRHGENGPARVHSLDNPLPTATCRGAGYLVAPNSQPLRQAETGAGEQPQPFHGSDRQHTAPRSMDEPIHTVTTLTGGGEYIVKPEAEPLEQEPTEAEPIEAAPFVQANRNNNAPKGVDQPIPTATTAPGGGSFLVKPGVQPFTLGQQSGSAPRSTDIPIPTVATDGAISLVRPTIVQYYGQSYAQDPSSPLSAITQCNKHGLASPTLIQYYGNGGASGIEKPVPTVTTRARHGLASPTLVEVNHGNSRAEQESGRRTPSLEEPLASPTTKRGLGVVNPAVIDLAQGNGPDGDKMSSPNGLRAGGQTQSESETRRENPQGAFPEGLGLAQPVLVQSSQTGGNGSYSRPTEQPLPTLTTKNDMNLVNPVAEPMCGQDEQFQGTTCEQAREIFKQAVSAAIDPRRIIFLDGLPYLLDIRFRMLENAELARAMGFSNEESQYEFVGNIGEVTKQIGNAVPVHLAAALVKSVLGPSEQGPAKNQ